MPLRAKILVSEGHFGLSKKSMSTTSQLPPDETADDVLFNSTYGVRSIELNRPGKLNALSGSMARKILERLQEWEKSQLANIVVIKGAGERAFCAGGDVAELAILIKEKGEEGVNTAVDYFEQEYTLDHLIATYSKPYVTFMDGITMGGGVGLSVHAPFRIATERTIFAMPETKIGFFPDVGGSFFLPRLDGETGTYLALTGETLRGAHVFYGGIATHYLHSSSLPDLEARLAELSFSDYATLEDKYRVVNSTIEEFNTGLPENNPFPLSEDIRELIDRCFCHNNLPSILTSLHNESQNPENPPKVSAFADQTLTTILQRCPISLRVTLQLLRYGKEWPISEAFQREFVLASRFMHMNTDFVNGVEAVLIKKPEKDPITGKAIPSPPPEWESKINWSPPVPVPVPAAGDAVAGVKVEGKEIEAEPTLSPSPTSDFQVSSSDEQPTTTTTPQPDHPDHPDHLDQAQQDQTATDLTYVRQAYFTIEEGSDRRLPLKPRYDYTNYPHAWIGLPSEREIRGAIFSTAAGRTRDEIVQYFVDKRRAKGGVKEKVEEVLKRMTDVGEDGVVYWKDVVNK